jgi:hypothetical protein
VHREVAELGEAEHAFNLGHEIWQFLRKLRVVRGGLDEVQRLSPTRYFNVAKSKPLHYTLLHGFPLFNPLTDDIFIPDVDVLLSFRKWGIANSRI